MKRKQLQLAALIVILAAVGVGGWIAAEHKVAPLGSKSTSSDWSAPFDQPPPRGFSYGQADPSQPPATREQVIARADQFYIDKLGQANFKKYYQRLPERDAFSSLPESAFDFIGYISKIDKLNGYDTPKYENPSDAVEFVQVNRTNLKEVYGHAPDCQDDAKQCDFKVTRQQAIDIAKKRGLGGDLSVKTNSDNKGRYFLQVTSCQDKKDVHIDYSSGRIIRVVEGCQPVLFDDFGGGS
jgi:hypothetical protein